MRAFSFLTNPVWSVLYLFVLLAITIPQSFGMSDIASQTGILLFFKIGITTVLLPFLSFLLLKGLGFSGSLSFASSKERIIPYIIVATFYLWIFINISKSGGFPLIFKHGLLGIILSLFGCFIINIQTKISPHIAAISSLIMFLILYSSEIPMQSIYAFGKAISLGNSILPVLLLLLSFLIMARNGNQKRPLQEIYGAIAVGVVSQILAAKTFHIFLFVNYLYMFN
jgi:hypothetical protein